LRIITTRVKVGKEFPPYSYYKMKIILNIFVGSNQMLNVEYVTNLAHGESMKKQTKPTRIDYSLSNNFFANN